MLTSRTLVQISKSKTLIPAGQLKAGSHIYDSFSRKYRKVRRVLLRTLDVRQLPALTPVLIRRGSLHNGVPRADIHLSPRQAVLAARKYGKDRSEFQKLYASDLAEDPSAFQQNAETRVTYVTPLFDRPGFVVCAGLLVCTTTPETLGLTLQVSKEKVS